MTAIAKDDGRRRGVDTGVTARSSLRKVSIEPVGVTVEIGADETLLAAIAAAAIDLPVGCGGRGTCGKCLVRLGAGELAAPTDAEQDKLSAEQLERGWRLACQATALSARVSIEVRATGGHRQIPTASRLERGDFHPAVVKETVSLPPASFQDSRSDLQRVRDGLGVKRAPLSVLRRLPDVLRAGGFSATLTRYEDELIDVEPATTSIVAYGAAVDIGTSKIIAYLVDLHDGRLIDQEALENPQMRYGEDVVTRITQAIESGRLGELARAAREGINQTLERLFKRHTILARHLYDMTVVGNTAMHHLALGLSPLGLAGAPFAPALDEPLTVRAGELSLAMNAEGRVHFLPPIAGFVGSDCLAVIAATRLETQHRPAMAIDIGTNTEIALVRDGHIAVTSCASGPAFEGYQITCGMKASEGAIERVGFTPDGRPDTVGTIGGGEPVGICGSGVVDVLAGLVRSGVIDKTGLMKSHELVREGNQGREYLLARGAHGDIVFTQHDVRDLQLAKGAIAAGWSLLLKREGLSPQDLSHVYVAGAFGNYLDLDNSLAIGLLPPTSKDRVEFVGNAAGVGAQMALVDGSERDRIAELRRGVEFLELATDAAFHEVFVRELTFDGGEAKVALGVHKETRRRDRRPEP